MPNESTAPDQIPATLAEGEAAASLPPAAQRALAEAEARRLAAQALDLPVEHLGPKGAEPTRFGDWERKGIASDF